MEDAKVLSAREAGRLRQRIGALKTQHADSVEELRQKKVSLWEKAKAVEALEQELEVLRAAFIQADATTADAQHAKGRAQEPDLD